MLHGAGRLPGNYDIRDVVDLPEGISSSERGAFDELLICRRAGERYARTLIG
jgi:hypothetical protein